MTIELLPGLLAGSLAAGGDRVAVVAGGRSLSFVELDERSARLAGWLRANVAGRFVVLVCSHAVDDVVVHVAALRAGKVLAPLDAREPVRRVREVVELLGCGVVLGASSGVVDGVSGFVLVADAVAAGAPDRVWYDWDPAETAWLYFTSGSTGEPKATLLPLGRRVPDQFMSTTVSGGDRVGATRPLSFMAGGTAALASVAHGGTAYLLDVSNITPSDLVDTARSLELDRIDLPTSLFRGEEGTESIAPVESVIEVRFIGERCLAQDLRVARQLFPRARLGNSYGSSEFGTVARLVIDPLDPIPEDPVPVGRPFHGVTIVDDDFAEVAPGEIGRLVVTTPHPVDGYLEPGGPVPLETIEIRPGARAIVSGDVGFVDGDGVLFVVGRRDDVVKVNGQLVSVGAVQVALLRHGDVVDAVVVPFEGVGGRTRLGAVVQVREGVGVSSRELRRFLVGELAAYMVPSRMVVGESVPVSLRGKTDRVRVVEMFSGPLSATLSSDLGDPVMWQIVNCLVRFVDVDGLSPTENLQYCGLDSLDAVEFIEMVSQAVGVPVPLSLLAGEWSLASLREWVLSDRSVRRPRVVRVVSGSNPTTLLWVMPGINVIACTPLASSFDGYTSLVMVNRGADSLEGPLVGTDAIAKDLFGEYLRVVCETNVVVIGFSSAGWIAHRLAGLMRGAGIDPRLLVMIDPPSLDGLRAVPGDLDPVKVMLAREGELAFLGTTRFDVEVLALQLHGLRDHEPERFEGRSLLVMQDDHRDRVGEVTRWLADPEVLWTNASHLEIMRDPTLCGPAIRAVIDQHTR